MEKKKELIINVLYYGLILALVYLGFKYVLPPLVPFVVAFIMVFLLKRPIKAICRKFAFHDGQAKLFSIILLIVFYSLIIGSLVLLIIGCISMIKSLADIWPTLYAETIKPFFGMVLSGGLLNELNLPSEITYAVNVVINSISSSFETIISFISSFVVAAASSLITSVPNFFISVVICVIASFFIMIDYDKITDYALGMMNDEIKYYYLEIKSFLVNKVFIIIKAYLKIMTITFVELFIGFTIIGLDNAFVIALSIAIFDILPVFGTGGIMIPWIIICLLQQKFILGLELFVIYIVVTIIRNIIEPKIVGAELGLHPLVILASMLIGVRFFGVLGLFGLPIVISFLLYERKEKQIKKEALAQKKG